MATSVAIYARHSTDKQTESAQDQIDRCRRFCANKGYEVTRIYRDEALSGDTMTSRGGIQTLVEEALEGLYDSIVAEDLSRFSRDQGDVCHFFRKMSYLGIEIETVAEGIINELHIGLKGTMNALYLRDLSDKTRRGMIASVLKGRVSGGRTYGYDILHELDHHGEKKKGLRAINKREAAVVRSIFDLYEQGRTPTEICDHLNGRRIVPPKGAIWRTTTLIGQMARKTGLLRQTLYKGEVTFNRMRLRKNPETGKRVSVLRPEQDWIRVPIPELAIIGAEQFERVQTAIEERYGMRKRRKVLRDVLTEEEKAARQAEYMHYWRNRERRDLPCPVYLVSGRLWCAEHEVKTVTTRSRIYACPEEGCRNRHMRLDCDLMPAVLGELGKFSAAGLHRWAETQAGERENLKARLEAVTAELSQARSGVRNVLNTLAAGRTTKETAEWFEEQEKVIRRLEYDRIALEKHHGAISGLTAPVRKQITAKFHEAVQSLADNHEAEVFDHDMTKRVRSWIRAIRVSSRPGGGKTKYRCCIDYDWTRLLEDLRHMP